MNKCLLFVTSCAAIATIFAVPVSRANASAGVAFRGAAMAPDVRVAYGPDGRVLSPAERGSAAVIPGVHGDVRDFGHADPRTPVQLSILMQVRNRTALENLVLAQSNRRSVYYHHYLTKEQFNELFAPTKEVYARTMLMLQRRGFRVTQTFPNRSMIGVTTTAGTAERYFSTRLDTVYQQRRGVRYINTTPAIMPAELRDVAVSVAGLHSISMVHFPIRFGDPKIIRHSHAYALVAARVAAERLAARRAGKSLLAFRHGIPVHRHRNVPTPGTSTPAPGPEPTESPESPDTDYLNYYGYGPPIFAEGYDYPLQHGYGGLNHAAGSVIDVDYLDSDMNTEYSTFLTPAGIKHTGTTSPYGYRVCADPNATANCDGTIGAPDADGEATLDATAIMTEAPYADFYEFIAPAFNDTQIEAAYEIAVSQDKVDAVNSSFGGCETDDPNFEYATSYIAMEGASLGISFAASAGDTGAYSCGTYVSNGTVQGFLNTSTPADDNYFTGVGGTSYIQITPLATDDYQGEVSWAFGGGGHSVIEPIPSWQTALVAQSSPLAMVSTTYRDVPDITMVADPGLNPDGFIGGTLGGGLVICHNGALTDAGGTSLASPMWVAMQTDINDAQHSRNGFVNPSLYAIAATSSAEYAFAFRDITAGTNAFYTAETGYDIASTGIGSPLGWELAGAPEYGTPGATAAPIASPTPTPTASPVATGGSPTPSPTPASTSTPHQSGTNFTVTTIGGAACTMSGASTDAGVGNMACFANPTAIQYVPAGTSDAQSTTDPFVFVTDYATGFLRGQDLTTSAVATYNNTTWSNLGAVGNSPSQLFGLAYQTSSGTGVAYDGLFVVNAENNTTNQIALPTTLNAAPSSLLKNLSGGASAEAWDGTGTDLATVSETDDTLHILTVAGAEGLDLTASTALPTEGNFGIAFDGAATLPTYVITDSGLNEVFTATDVPGTTEVPVNTSTLTTIAMGAPLNHPKQITYVSGTSAFYVANCGGNDILRISAASPYTVTVAAGYGAPTEKDGANTGAAFNCPWGITNDGTNLYVTDQGGGTVREITNLI